MDKQIKVKVEFNSLEKILEFLSHSSYKCSKEYDIWDVRTDLNGQMKQCVVLTKGSMHGMKMYFSEENVLNATYIIPNKIMNAYFGKSQKMYRNIIEIIAGWLKDLLLSSSQKKAFGEMLFELNGISLSD